MRYLFHKLNDLPELSLSTSATIFLISSFLGSNPRALMATYKKEDGSQGLQRGVASKGLILSPSGLWSQWHPGLLCQISWNKIWTHWEDQDQDLKASLISDFCSSVRSSLAGTAFLFAPPDILTGLWKDHSHISGGAYIALGNLSMCSHKLDKGLHNKWYAGTNHTQHAATPPLYRLDTGLHSSRSINRGGYLSISRRKTKQNRKKLEHLDEN